MEKYFVAAWVWNPELGEYEYKVLFETEDKLEAEERFNQTEVTDDMPQVMLNLDGEDYVDRLYTKDSTGVFANY